ncbi:hypothetical protein TRFO_17137 [Tritrichomonas foetus]|uniref:UEV domain-containing protein n=1 Tax=Tritrichomonas foetus TaxID=1144522 RepID=A0A1J4KNR8_9EUKA|nr:hypothetical protein TRFO_17137 [Tritrichomonas foetus]|eukprot:OHT12875.1 hypothetical protein TRFO_17137 [Tritrichomonas foetus]
MCAQVQRLIRSIQFNPQYIQQIGMDLNQFLSTYRTMKSDVIQTPGVVPYIQLLGKIALTHGRNPYEITLLIQITNTYPIYPPTFYFQPITGVPFNNVPNLQANGAIIVTGIFQWSPAQNLCNAVGWIINYFSQYPPITPHASAPKQAAPSSVDLQKCYENALIEGECIISSCNDANSKLYEVQTELAMINHLRTTLDALSAQYLHEEPKKAPKKDAFYNFPPNIQQEIEMKAQEKASKAVINAFKDAFKNGDIDMDKEKFISEINNMNRQHFQKFVWPQLIK